MKENDSKLEEGEVIPEEENTSESNNDDLEEHEKSSDLESGRPIPRHSRRRCLSVQSLPDLNISDSQHSQTDPVPLEGLFRTLWAQLLVIVGEESFQEETQFSLRIA